MNQKNVESIYKRRSKDRAGHILNDENTSDKKKLNTFLLLWFLGFFGVHRFYAGKVGTGLLFLFTFGLFGIGVLIDFIVILSDGFKDKSGKKITQWV